MNPNQRKFLLVGDALAGKTALLLAFTTGTVDKNNIPLEIESIEVEIEVDCHTISLQLWDVSVRADHMRTRLRPLAYAGTHILLLCFSIADPWALESVIDRWLPEIVHFTTPNTPPVLLVGCQKDQRNDQATLERLRQMGERPVQYDEGAALARSSFLVRKYFECSAVTGEGIREIFLYATEAAKRYQIPRTSRKRAGCVIA